MRHGTFAHFASLVSLVLHHDANVVAFSTLPCHTVVDLSSRRSISLGSSTTENISTDPEMRASKNETGVDATRESLNVSGMPDLVQDIKDKIGAVDDSRFAYPEYKSGDVPRMFSTLEYVREGENKISSKHAAGSVVGSAALIAGTTVGAGILALPSATLASGFIPSSVAMISAYVYMTMSGLLVAELTLNRMGQTGRPGLGLLDLYESSLGKTGGMVGTAAYFFLHYAMMVAYIAQGGKDVEQIFGWDQYGSIAFAGVMGLSLFFGSNGLVEKVNNVMVLGVVGSFLSIVTIGAQTADFSALIQASNQHPEKIASCLPILFLAFVYQNVVPTVVSNLEGDRSKITKAIVGGTALPLVMFLAWNAVCLGNAITTGADLSQVDPVALLQAGEAGGTVLGPLVTAFSSLALITSLIGFTYGLIDAWTDRFNIPLKGEEFKIWKPALFSLVFGPPLVMSLTNPDIFYNALEYGGAFGVSTLFLVLPPLMVWKERYRDTDKPLMTDPMVPFGKLPLASMWKSAAALIVERTAEQLGFFDWLSDTWEGWVV